MENLFIFLLFIISATVTLFIASVAIYGVVFVCTKIKKLVDTWR